ncbi:hypothetical protein FISHEDRAFT_65593 [Fistulina hepatica ATCC 64428]|uniref:GST N-terminal domain-containing protein n=1 Tax=Fistulina hepatica ATCC 64428 TaxID=1128425 RepID=A0A0D7AEL4_9AGAR|nr:hypothetical protein FISHEDRAFT_65593 [Fistulina hepatica ATCC 64428]
MSAISDSGKTYRNECTGEALATVQKHSGPQDIVLFGSCFCPFVQRVWVAFEYLRIPYQYYEVDPYKKPQDLLEISPKGLVPGLKLNQYHPPRSLNESTVIVEYLEDLAKSASNRSLLPTDPYARGLVRLQVDHINRTLAPAFYRFLQAQEPESQVTTGREFHDALEGLVSLLERGKREIVSTSGTAGAGEAATLRKGLGLYFGDGDLGLTDVMAGPSLPRLQLPAFDKLFKDPHFRCTCSTEDLYLDSYERYAYNRPNTSQVADAINSGRGLP